MVWLVMLAAATQGNDYVLIYGMGTVSCATAWEAANARSSSEWIMGFWSGRNFEGSHMVGESTDRPGIEAEIRRKCQEDPTKGLIATTVETYNRLRAEGR